MAFYERIVRGAGEPVLELACGTGHISLPLSNAGLHVTGVDRSEAMLAIARRELATLPASVQERLTLVKQDMSALDLGRRFGLVFVPFRSFQALLTIDLQRKSLEAIRRDLETTGRLALDLFDPRLDWLADLSIALPGFPAFIPKLDGATRERFFQPVSIISTKFVMISGDTPKSDPLARCSARTLARLPCTGLIAGSCIISSTCAAS